MTDTVPVPSDEARMRDEYERYRKLIDATPICIKMFDASGKLLFVNQGGRREHFIKDDADVSQWDWAGTVKEAYRERVMAAFQKGLKGEASRLVMEHTPEGSDHQWCEGIISPILDERGQVSMVLFNSIDVTEKRKAEIALADKTKDLETRNEELGRLNRMMIGRELKMVELKEQIRRMTEEKGKSATDSKE